MNITRNYTDEELSKLDPELDRIFQSRGIPKLAIPTRKTIARFRKGYNAATQRYNTSQFAKAALGSAFDKPDWTETDKTIPVRDGRQLKIRIYTPSKATTGGSPVFIFFHGGGWIAGDLETEALCCQIFCSKLKMAVVNVDYGLYPEVLFGIPQFDCYDTIKWVAANAPSFGGDLRKGFIVGGNSGGGTYASIAVHLARDENLEPPITGCYLTCPILSDAIYDNDGKHSTKFDHSTEYRSWDQCQNAPLMNDEMRRAIEDFAEYDWRSPLLSPFHFSHHNNIPPTYIAVVGIDPWRDGGLIYGRELEKAGTITKVDLYPGLLHCWWNTFPQISASQKWLQNSLTAIQWLLKESNKRSVSAKL